MPAATTNDHIVFFVAKLQERYPVPLGCLDPVLGLSLHITFGQFIQTKVFYPVLDTTLSQFHLELSQI